MKQQKRTQGTTVRQGGEAVTAATFDKEAERRGWDFIADRARERKMRGSGMKREGDRVCGRKRRGQQ